MSFSKVMADRMMLDIHSLILALKYVIDVSLAKREEEYSRIEAIIIEVKKDIDRIEKDFTLTDSLDTFYDLSVEQYSSMLNEVIQNIEKKSLHNACKTLDELSVLAEEKLSEHLPERVS